MITKKSLFTWLIIIIAILSFSSCNAEEMKKLTGGNVLDSSTKELTKKSSNTWGKLFPSGKPEKVGINSDDITDIIERAKT